MKEQYPEPKEGSIWLNTNRKELFQVFGMVAPCTDSEDEWEILYRSFLVPRERFRRRSLEEWYGTNRHGQPRFIEILPSQLAQLAALATEVGSLT